MGRRDSKDGMMGERELGEQLRDFIILQASWRIASFISQILSRSRCSMDLRWGVTLSKHSITR